MRTSGNQRVSGGADSRGDHVRWTGAEGPMRFPIVVKEEDCVRCARRLPLITKWRARQYQALYLRFGVEATLELLDPHAFLNE
jgi:hypothetical protein